MEQKEKFIAQLNDYLEDSLHTSFEAATPEQIYKALARVVNGQLRDKYVEFKHKKNKSEKASAGKKKIYYICMEFLMGQSLKNALYCLGETDIVRELVEGRGMSLDDVFDCVNLPCPPLCLPPSLIPPSLLLLHLMSCSCGNPGSVQGCVQARD